MIRREISSEAKAEYTAAKKIIAVMGATGTQMAAGLRAPGQEVLNNAVPPEGFRGFGFPGAEGLGKIFQFKHDFNEEYGRARSIQFSRSLNPAMQNLATWAMKNKDRIPLV